MKHEIKYPYHRTLTKAFELSFLSLKYRKPILDLSTALTEARKTNENNITLLFRK